MRTTGGVFRLKQHLVDGHHKETSLSKLLIGSSVCHAIFLYCRLFAILLVPILMSNCLFYATIIIIKSCKLSWSLFFGLNKTRLMLWIGNQRLKLPQKAVIALSISCAVFCIPPFCMLSRCRLVFHISGGYCQGSDLSYRVRSWSFSSLMLSLSCMGLICWSLLFTDSLTRMWGGVQC